MLAGLWPVYGGKLTCPKASTLFYVPQRPYLTVGSFRAQIAYPATEAQMRERGISDAMLLAVLQHAQLQAL